MQMALAALASDDQRFPQNLDNSINIRGVCVVHTIEYIYGLRGD